MDAKLNLYNLVRIKFTLGSESKTKINPYFSDLLSHVQSCGFKLDAALKDRFTYLVIEDFGTTGLDGSISRTDVNDEQKSNYYNMWWREGISPKEGRDAGRWGLGKTVFFICSELRSFWGLTIRHDDKRQLLLGKALLKSHQYNGTHYDYYGYYCEGENQPIEDPREIQKFKNLFQVSRNGESGFSIVIPYPVADITHHDLVRAVIQHYFYSIIRGLLTVEINQDSQVIILDKKSIFEIASHVNWKGTSWENHPVSSLLYFIYSAVNMPESQELREAEADLTAAEQSLAAGHEKWAIIQGYFSIFHSLRSKVMGRGYREKSHRCLKYAVEALLIDEGQLEPSVLDHFSFAMDVREGADYGYIYDTESARMVVSLTRTVFEMIRESDRSGDSGRSINGEDSQE